MKSRRNEYDVTDKVKISDAEIVGQAVTEIFTDLFPNADASHIARAFEDFELLYTGRYNGFRACDTLYHDQQHSLDMALALMRLIDGYERSQPGSARFGPDWTVVGVITGLFHDSGYIRADCDTALNGAQYTKTHVSRSARFLSRYLPQLGLEAYEPVATQIVHYTGYEIAPENIRLRDPKHHTLGFMLGTADLIAQMSDRCYLEKCRDRLYPEFVLGGVARQRDKDGRDVVVYESGNDLVSKTPGFYNGVVIPRLIDTFKEVYRFASKHFDGDNPYINGVTDNQQRVRELLENNRLDALTRRPPPNRGTLSFPGLDYFRGKMEETAPQPG